MVVRSLLSLGVLLGAAVGAAQTATAPSESVDGLIAEVLARLTARDSVQFEVAYRDARGGGSGGELTLRVSMWRRGAFAVRVFSGDQEICGAVGDGERVTEWDHRLRQWTRYPVAERAPEPLVPRLVMDRAGQTPVVFALSRYLGSWLATPSSYEWYLQRLQTADEVSARRSEVNGTRVRDLAATQAIKGAPVPLAEKVRFAFDAETRFPVLEEIRIAGPMAALVSGMGYTFQYRSVASADAQPPAWEPPEGYSFVAPETLRPVTPPLVGKSIADWNVKRLDGAELPLHTPVDTAPTVVVVWATWCGPCKLELETLAKLQKDGDLKGVRVVTVSIDRSPDAVRRFVEDRKLAFPVGHDPEFLRRVEHASGVPTTLVVDPAGVVRDMWSGWGDGEAGLRRLRAALRMSPDPAASRPSE